MSTGGPPTRIEVPGAGDGARFGLLRSGRVAAVFQRPAGRGARILVCWSDDDGDTWTAPEPLLALDEAQRCWSFGLLLVDQEDEFHLFFLIPQEGDAGAPADAAGAGEGERPLVGQLLGRRIDIGYARSLGGRRRWSRPRVLWIGYTGALNSAIQTAAGRILLPFSFLTSRTWAARGDGPESFTFVGQYDSAVLSSADGGLTWTQSGSLRTPVPDIVSAYGAVEPVVVERGDGTIWMLIRTQMGRFWESTSRDGVGWSLPRPTGILSSDSPAGLVRLGGDRLVLLWNDCRRYPYAYGGRQVLHAALSDDHGATWRGCREVARDPRAWEPPPPSGDHGTAYPFPCALASGRVLFVSGQGAGRVTHARLDPAWLLATEHAADFDARPEEWSFFGTRGVEWETMAAGGPGRALRLRKTEPAWPATAVWNFPASQRGALTLVLRPRPGAAPAEIVLTDHFSAPCDLEDRLAAVFVAELPFAGNAPDAALPVRLAWDLAEQRCDWWIAGEQARPLARQRYSAGICYLRLRPATGAGEIDTSGFRLEAATFAAAP